MGSAGQVCVRGRPWIHGKIKVDSIIVHDREVAPRYRGTPTPGTVPHIYRTKGPEEQVLGAVQRACVLAWAPITQHHRLGGLSSRNLFLTVLEAGHGQVPAWSGSGEGSLLSLQTTTFLWYLHMAERQSMGASNLSGLFF